MRGKIMAKLGKKSTTVEISDFPPILSVPFATTLRIEAFLSRKVRFPIGLWLFALAENQSQEPST
jgi:hypothetical protein